VHVPEPNNVSFTNAKPSFGVEFSANALIRLTFTFRSKYQSKWYRNALALTICVNANELGFSPNAWQPFALLPASSGVVPPAWIGDRRMSQRLGDLLVKEKIITTEQLEQANKVQKEQSCRLGSALVKLGFLTDEDVTNFLSRQYGVPAINLSYFEIDPAVVKLIPFETAKRYQILPLSRVGASLTIAMVDPTNVFAMDDIKFMTGFNIEPVVASESSILSGLTRLTAARATKRILKP
jgi:hypothetical protein